MDSIARRAGITKGGIYHHFGSKDEILLAVNKKLEDPVAEMIAAAEATPDAAEAISGFIADYLGYWSDHPKEMSIIYLSFTKVLGSPELKVMYVRYTHWMRGFMSGLYKRGIAAGLFRAHDPDLQALALLASLEGTLQYALVDPEPDPQQILRRLQQLFVRDLMGSPGGRGESTPT